MQQHELQLYAGENGTAEAGQPLHLPPRYVSEQTFLYFTSFLGQGDFCRVTLKMIIK
jgi:hypothetical protein